MCVNIGAIELIPCEVTANSDELIQDLTDILFRENAPPNANIFRATECYMEGNISAQDPEDRARRISRPIIPEDWNDEERERVRELIREFSYTFYV